MPVYNEEENIARALESVLYQNVNFNYEIIIIDDNSSDRTVEIINKYRDRFGNITLLVNNKNYGKGYGTIRGYETASGQYFHMLDGDDFFIDFNKLQKQVDFLDENSDYVAIAHNSLIIFDDYRISFVSNIFEKRSYEYEEAISNKFYFHTSSFMFRKIQDRLPEIFLNKPLRGDSALFFYHVFQTKKKVMYYPDISSVYNYHGRGIWSGISNKEKYILLQELYKAYLDLIIVDKNKPEYLIWQKKLDYIRNEKQYKEPKYNKRSIDELLTICRDQTAKIYDNTIRKKAFEGMNGFREIDQVCEAIGKITLFFKGYLINDREYDNNKIAILVSGFSPNGGGVFKEIKELIDIYLEEGKFIEIFCTNQIPTEKEIIKIHFSDPRIRFWQVNNKTSYSKQLESLIDEIYKTSPVKIYPFMSHHDVIMNSAIQKGLGKYVILDYVYDHGLSLGIHNSSIDKFIIKTESQINALRTSISSNKLIYIPHFYKDQYHCNPYNPYQNGSLTTASASARSYKINSDYKYPYNEIIPEVLKITNGFHYHYGPLTDEFKDKIFSKMSQIGVDLSRFVHIDWSENLSKSLIERGVDLFISPFPIPSARIMIEVMSSGIPLMNHLNMNSKLPQASDFCDTNQLFWEKPDDLFEILMSLNKTKLLEKSKSARHFFEENNDFNLVKKNILNEEGKPYQINNKPNYVLTDLQYSVFFKETIINKALPNDKNRTGIMMNIKNYLKKYLPTSSNTFNYRINVLNEKIDGLIQLQNEQNNKIDEIIRLYDKQNKEIVDLLRLYDERCKKINEIHKK